MIGRILRETNLMVFLVLVPAFIAYVLTSGNLLVSACVGAGFGLLRLLLIAAGIVDAGRYGEGQYFFRGFWRQD